MMKSVNVNVDAMGNVNIKAGKEEMLIMITKNWDKYAVATTIAGYKINVSDDWGMKYQLEQDDSVTDFQKYQILAMFKIGIAVLEHNEPKPQPEQITE